MACPVVELIKELRLMPYHLVLQRPLFGQSKKKRADMHPRAAKESPEITAGYAPTRLWQTPSPAPP
jgi:hypothetical protein